MIPHSRADRHPVERSLLNRWAAVVDASPARAAFSSSGRTVSFAEADRSATTIARNTLARSNSPEGPLGVLTDLTADGLVALLGALKTGRPVVPLDPHLPPGRLEQITETAGLRSCLVGATQQATARSLAADVDDVLFLPDLVHPSTDGAVQLPVRSGADPAVVVFTSGSTGRPKGVVLTHDLLLDSADTARERFGLHEEDRMLLALPLSFTAGMLVAMSAVLNGAGTWAYDPRDRPVRELPAWIADHGLTTFHGTPHLLRSLVGALRDDQVLEPLRLVVTAGEVLFGRDVQEVRRHLRAGTTVVNWAGSSEVGSLCSYVVPGGTAVPAGALPVGRPEPTKEVRILRSDGSCAAVGETGEISVTSSYLSGGYWRDPVRTAERFTDEADGRRTYRLGDLGKLDEHGDLHMLGRMDAAVKVRGYLVELSEVEAALHAMPSVAEAVVVAVAAGTTTRLVAYVAHLPEVLVESPGAIRRTLREQLPEYMVPTAIVPLPRLPRTERGKVDRLSLPPAPARAVPTAPATAQEELVAGIWGQVLGLDDVGAQEDFWELGGDSLALEEMLALVESEFGTHLVSRDLVEAPTLEEFTRKLAPSTSARPSSPPTTVSTLRAHGVGTPIFCFAGAGALAASFVALSRRLGDRPVHAFQAHGIEHRALPDWTVGQVARRHLSTMRHLQPEGPYVLVGHSFGGLVAMEVARQLSRDGQPVALLSLLDTYLPTPRTLERPGPTSALGSLRDLGRRLCGRVLPDGLPPLHQWPERSLTPLAGIVRFRGNRQYDVFFNQGQVISRRHEVQPYDGQFLLVLGEGNPGGPAQWDGLLTGSGRVEHFECDHNSILRPPHVDRLAALVLRRLEEVAG